MKKTIGYLKIWSNDLRNLCIVEKWYTKGDTRAYSNLLYTLAEEKPNITAKDVVEIAEDIKAHSNTEDSIADICYKVWKIATPFFVEL